MSLTKFASYEVSEVLALKGAPARQRTASLDKIADFENYRTSDGYLYARIRAISSRVNKNHDGWPSVELAGSREIFDRHHSGSGFTVEAADGDQHKGFATFVGKPIFVDHHNSDPDKARGVIVDAKFKVLDHRTAATDDYWTSSDADPEHLPPTEVELLLEVDAKTFPKLAEAIVSGDLDGFSMGCDVEYSKCSHCGHEASSPDEYCSHIVMKGATHDYKTADGHRTSKKSYENCYGIHFFEISAVFDPADETARSREVRAAVLKEGIAVDPYAQGDEPANIPDPARPDDEAKLNDLAMTYHMQGLDWEQSIEMARNNLMRGPIQQPGAGDGQVYSPKVIDFHKGQPGAPQFDRNGMPGPGGLQGSPPPVYPQQREQEWQNPAFVNDAQDALNEQWPQRPVMNDWRNSHTHTAENPLPQSFEVRAPDEVDTLREEQLCPICGNDMDAETCQVCGYVQPPKEFDNPDLNKADEIRQEMKQDEAQQAGIGDQQPSPSGDAPGGTPTAAPGGAPGGAPGAGGMGGVTGSSATNTPTKPLATAKLKNEMSWTPLVHPKTAARINQVETPVTPSNRPVSDEPKKETVTSDQTRPVTAAMQTARDLMARAQRNHTGDQMNRRTADGPTPPGDTSADKRVNVTDMGGVDQASNEEASKARAQVDVTGIGGTGVSDVSPDSTESLPTASEGGDDSGFNTDKTTDDSGPTKTWGDSDGSHSGISDPVTSEPFPRSEDGVKSNVRRAYDDGTLEQNEQQGDPVAQGGSAVKGVQPIAEQFGDRVNVLEHTTSPSNNSGPTTTWNGTDGNGVLKQVDPVTKDRQEWGGVPVPDVQLHTNARTHFMSTLRLAEAEVELGLIPHEGKYERMAQLERESPESIKAQLTALARVKTAGLAKLAQQRQSGVRRLPTSFGKNTAAPNGFERIASDSPAPRETVTDDQLDAALFTR